jgi:hypothetical protein
MPIDLSAIGNALQRGFSEIPPIATALILLAGPTLALIGYRLISVARRMQASPAIEAAPLWVCHDCRSVNEFRLSRCYRCGVEREAAGEIEVIVDHPLRGPSTFDAPAGSPFAALGAPNQPMAHGPGPGVPVMDAAGHPSDGVAVGPGRSGQTRPATEDAVASAPERRR